MQSFLNFLNRLKKNYFISGRSIASTRSFHGKLLHTETFDVREMERKRYPEELKNGKQRKKARTSLSRVAYRYSRSRPFRMQKIENERYDLNETSKTQFPERPSKRTLRYTSIERQSPN
mgnify:CR=1 FL=1